MPPEEFPQELQGRSLIPGLGDLDLQHLTFVIHHAPEVMLDAADLHEHPIPVPAPAEGAHLAHPLSLDFSREHGPERLCQINWRRPSPSPLPFILSGMRST